MLRALLTVALLFFSFSAVYAAPFSYEASILHTQSDTDFTETDTTVVEGTYYLQPVVVKKEPLAEAGFVARASSLSLNYTRRSLDANLSFIAQPLTSLGALPPTPFTPNPMISVNPIPTGVAFVTPSTTVPNFIPGPGPGEDEDIWGTAGRYVSTGGWIGELSYSKSSDERSSGTTNFTFSSDSDVTRLSLGAGKYFGPATTVTLQYDSMSSEFGSETVFNGMTLSPPPVPALIAPPSRSRSEATTRGYTLTAKTLLKKGNYHHSLDASVGYDVLESDVSITFQGSNVPFQAFSDKSYALRSGFGYVFYLRQELGFGIGYRSVDAEFGTDKTWDLTAEWFATPDISIRASYLSTDSPGRFNDAEGFGVGITGRF